ncbi:hypothetical protein HZS_1302, partial [Henneguya salminicola]
ISKLLLQKKKPVLLLNGYSYRVDKVNSIKNITSGRCILKECKSRMKTNNIFDEGIYDLQHYPLLLLLDINSRDDKNIEPKYFGYTSGI